ncbi:ATP-dependent sacrificial sulfur transferase LarE [Candidatus Nitrospira bockiana]
MPADLSDKLHAMESLLTDMGSVVVAFSGGIDSTVVLKVARDCLSEHAIGVTAVSPTFPEIELELSRRLAAEIGARHLILETDQLRLPDFIRNDGTRCYHCKTDLYQALDRVQRQVGARAVVDGTHLDDLGDDRPGLRAAREWGVRSLLVEAGLCKADVRNLARALGLSNWDKPAAACLSSRIPRGTTITVEKLRRVERAERVLFDEGFNQFRVRDHGDVARLELDAHGLALMGDTERRVRVSEAVKKAGFRFVTVDPDGYRQGGGNRPPS